MSRATKITYIAVSRNHNSITPESISITPRSHPIFTTLFLWQIWLLVICFACQNVEKLSQVLYRGRAYPCIATACIFPRLLVISVLQIKKRFWMLAFNLAKCGLNFYQLRLSSRLHAVVSFVVKFDYSRSQIVERGLQFQTNITC